MKIIEIISEFWKSLKSENKNPFDNHENHKNLRNSWENNENNENYRNQLTNNENH